MILALEKGLDVISLDESAFTNNQCNTKGWVKKQSLAIKSSLRKFKCISLISAVFFKGKIITHLFLAIIIVSHSLSSLNN